MTSIVLVLADGSVLVTSATSPIPDNVVEVWSVNPADHESHGRPSLARIAVTSHECEPSCPYYE